MLANLDARDIGSDGLELPPHFGRRIRLQVEHVLMRRTSRKEDEDDRLVLIPRAAKPRGRLSLQDLRQRQPAQSERTDAEEVATRNAIAIPATGRPGPKDRQHKDFEDEKRENC